MMMGYGYGGSFGWLGMGLSMVVHLAFAFMVILATIWLFKTVFRGGNAAHSGKDALSILKQRYAKGEISEEEYNRIKKDLE